MYGPDLLHALTFTSDTGCQSSRGDHWLSAGYAHCLRVHSEHNRNLPCYYWHETTHLANLIRTPDQFLTELKDTLDR